MAISAHGDSMAIAKAIVAVPPSTSDASVELEMSGRRAASSPPTMRPIQTTNTISGMVALDAPLRRAKRGMYSSTTMSPLMVDPISKRRSNTGLRRAANEPARRVAHHPRRTLASSPVVTHWTSGRWSTSATETPATATLIHPTASIDAPNPMIAAAKKVLPAKPSLLN